MLKKLLIACAGLLVSFVALYAGLNSMYNKNTYPADRILNSIETSTRNYSSQVQSGSFSYDTERSILNARLLEYKQLTQWAIRPHVKRRFEGVLGEAEQALSRAQEWELSSQQAREEADARAAAAMREMMENQRRSGAQN